MASAESVNTVKALVSNLIIVYPTDRDRLNYNRVTTLSQQYNLSTPNTVRVNDAQQYTQFCLETSCNHRTEDEINT